MIKVYIPFMPIFFGSLLSASILSLRIEDMMYLDWEIYWLLCCFLYFHSFQFNWFKFTCLFLLNHIVAFIMTQEHSIPIICVPYLPHLACVCVVLCACVESFADRGPRGFTYKLILSCEKKDIYCPFFDLLMVFLYWKSISKDIW